jgi:hypothetical protein
MTSLVLEAAMMTNLSSHRINLNAKFSIGSMNDESYKKELSTIFTFYSMDYFKESFLHFTERYSY